MRRNHENSTAAYESITRRLPRRRRAVMDAILLRGPISRQGIAEAMNVPINEVTGRVRELLDENLVEETGTEVANGRRRALLKACPAQGRLLA